MKNIREMFNISYFDNKELSLKEHCDIYSNIKKELVSILNKYDIKYVLAETEVIKDLSKENQELKEKINGVYEERTYLYNKLSAEKEQLNILVNSCQEEIRQLKKQLEENKDNYNCLLKQKEQFEYIMSKQVDYQGQKKEFIKYLENEIKNIQIKWGNKLTENGYIDIAMTVRAYQIILQKYKSIIGEANDKK